MSRILMKHPIPVSHLAAGRATSLMWPKLIHMGLAAVPSGLRGYDVYGAAKFWKFQAPRSKFQGNPRPEL